MYKFWASIKKDFRILTRDWVGLSLMFAMPIVLVIVITSLQAGTFKLVNDNKISLLWCNADKGESSIQLKKTLENIGLFEITEIPSGLTNIEIADKMRKTNALMALIIPGNFSELIHLKAQKITTNALSELGFSDQGPNNSSDPINTITLYYHPVLQESYRSSVQGALRSAIQLVENKQILQTIYFSLNQKTLPERTEKSMINNQVVISEVPVSRDGSKMIPNASQHNIPAWTIFAMFFIVSSLGSNVVKEKLSGSSLRLKTLPTNYLVEFASKQFTYLGVCMVQVAVIFSIGVWLFPLIGLPKLNMPSDILGLLVVSLVCGWCAVSYAICVGAFAQSQEQANGFGSISIVILAALGGILVPSFAMPDNFQIFLKISPLHWCLESYYGLFLEGGKFKDILNNLLPLLGIIVFLQLFAFVGLKRNNFI
jgi:ABC-2 type transport system permease protein